MPGEIENLDIKIKLLKEFVNNGGVAELAKLRLVDDLYEIKIDRNGKVMPETVSRGIASIMNMLLVSELMPPVFAPSFISFIRQLYKKKNVSIRKISIQRNNLMQFTKSSKIKQILFSEVRAKPNGGFITLCSAAELKANYLIQNQATKNFWKSW